MKLGPKSVGAIAVTLIGAGALVVSNFVSAPTVPIQRGLKWDYTNSMQGITFEVWHSTNRPILADFKSYTNVTGTNIVFLKFDKAKEFFIVRARSNGEFSDWNIK